MVARKSIITQRCNGWYWQTRSRFSIGGCRLLPSTWKWSTCSGGSHRRPARAQRCNAMWASTSDQILSLWSRRCHRGRGATRKRKRRNRRHVTAYFHPYRHSLPLHIQSLAAQHYRVVRQPMCTSLFAIVLPGLLERQLQLKQLFGSTSAFLLF